MTVRKPSFLMTSLLIVVLLLPLSGGIVAAAGSNTPYTVAISPEMELLSGVLAQTEWMKHRGPEGAGNRYFQELKELFAPFQRHQAIVLAAQLTKRGFTYDAPVAFICHLGPLPELELRYEYSEYLIKRAGGREILEQFRLALRDLAREAQFMEFLAQWEGDFQNWLQPVHAGFNGNRVIAWLETFLASKQVSFTLS